MKLPFGLCRLIKKSQIFLLTKNRVVVLFIVTLPLTLLNTVLGLFSITGEHNSSISLNPIAVIIGWAVIAFWMWTLATQVNKVLPRAHQLQMGKTFRLLFLASIICSALMIAHYSLSILFSNFTNTYIDLALYLVFAATMLYIAWLTLNVMETYFTKLEYEKGDFFTELLRLSFGFIFIFGLYPKINKLFRARCINLMA